MSGSEHHVGAPACAPGFEQDPLREGRTVLEGPGCLHVNTTGHPARPSAQHALPAPLPSAAPSWWDWTAHLLRQVAPLWKALASNNRLARKVVTLLYVKLKLRPPKAHVRLSERTQLTSLLVSSAAPAHSPPCPSGRQGGLAEGLAVSRHGLMILSPTVGPEPLGFSRPSRVAW